MDIQERGVIWTAQKVAAIARLRVKQAHFFA